MFESSHPNFNDIPEPFRTNLNKNAHDADDDVTVEAVNFTYNKTQPKDMIFLLFILIMFYG